MIIKHKQTDTFMWDNNKVFPRTVRIDAIKIKGQLVSVAHAVEDYETLNLLGVSETEYNEAEAHLNNI